MNFCAKFTFCRMITSFITRPPKDRQNKSGQSLTKMSSIPENMPWYFTVNTANRYA